MWQAFELPGATQGVGGHLGIFCPYQGACKGPFPSHCPLGSALGWGSSGQPSGVTSVYTHLRDVQMEPGEVSHFPRVTKLRQQCAALNLGLAGSSAEHLPLCCVEGSSCQIPIGHAHTQRDAHRRMRTHTHTTQSEHGQGGGARSGKDYRSQMGRR